MGIDFPRKIRSNEYSSYVLAHSIILWVVVVTFFLGSPISHTCTLCYSTVQEYLTSLLFIWRAMLSFFVWVIIIRDIDRSAESERKEGRILSDSIRFEAEAERPIEWWRNNFFASCTIYCTCTASHCWMGNFYTSSISKCRNCTAVLKLVWNSQAGRALSILSWTLWEIHIYYSSLPLPLSLFLSSPWLALTKWRREEIPREGRKERGKKTSSLY